jgi:hypothetical protein
MLEFWKSRLEEIVEHTASPDKLLVQVQEFTAHRMPEEVVHRADLKTWAKAELTNLEDWMPRHPSGICGMCGQHLQPVSPIPVPAQLGLFKGVGASPPATLFAFSRTTMAFDSKTATYCDREAARAWC